MEQNDIQQSAKVLSIAVLNNPHHIGVFQGNGEKERMEIQNMFFKRFNDLPRIVFLTKENENVRFYEKFGFSVISRSDIFRVENRYMLRDSKG